MRNLIEVKQRMGIVLANIILAVYLGQTYSICYCL